MSEPYGFGDLTTDALSRLLATYDTALEHYKRGDVNYPCGSHPRTVKRWRAEVAAELLLRRAREARP